MVKVKNPSVSLGLRVPFDLYEQMIAVMREEHIKTITEMILKSIKLYLKKSTE